MVGKDASVSLRLRYIATCRQKAICCVRFFDFRSASRMWKKSETVFWIESDRKSTRLNSSHTVISYAVFCLKKKNKQRAEQTDRLDAQRRRAGEDTHPLPAHRHLDQCRRDVRAGRLYRLPRAMQPRHTRSRR